MRALLQCCALARVDHGDVIAAGVEQTSGALAERPSPTTTVCPINQPERVGRSLRMNARVNSKQLA